MKRFINIIAALTLLVTGIGIGLYARFSPAPASAQAGCRTFQETGKSVCGRFLQYWTQNGGLAQQGLPLTGEFTEVSDLNGQSYTVQYFERAVFEKHPENQPPYDVLLSQLGTFQFKRKYSNGEPAGNQPVPPAQPTPTHAAAAPPAGAQTFTGTGRQAVGPIQLHTGVSRWHSVVSNSNDNFVVWLLDAQGNDVDLVANEIGDSESSKIINIPKSGQYFLNVESDGNWTITVQQ